MPARRWLASTAALTAALLVALAAGCDRGGGSSHSPFRNLGKRSDSAVTTAAAPPAR